MAAVVSIQGANVLSLFRLVCALLIRNSGLCKMHLVVRRCNLVSSCDFSLRWPEGVTGIEVRNGDDGLSVVQVGSHVGTRLDLSIPEEWRPENSVKADWLRLR